MQKYCNFIIFIFFTKSIPLTVDGQLIFPVHLADVAR